MARYEDVFILKDKVSDALLNMTVSMEKFNKKLGNTQEILEFFRKETENIAKLGNKIKSIGQGMTVGITLPVIAAGGAMVKAAADMESMQQQLSTLMGSEQAGAKMFNEIKEMAAKTPFGTKDLIQATNTMLGFGIAQEEAIPIMKQLGDISGGNAERFQSLALAFSQASSAGKLQGQELNQMINAGFNPLEAIAKRTGKSIGYWKEQMGKGKVTVDMLKQAMKDATSVGGRYFGMMDKQSKTALGQWSTFQDELNMTLAEFGKVILPTAIKVLQRVSEILQEINKLSPETKELVVKIAAITAVFGPLLIVLGSVVTAFLALLPVFAFIAAGATPVVGIIAAITAAVMGLVAAIVKLVSMFKIWKKNKIKSINTGFSEEETKKLQAIREKIGDDKFTAQFGQDVAKSIGIKQQKNYTATNNDNSVKNSNNVYHINNYGSNNIAQLTASAKYAI